MKAAAEGGPKSGLIAEVAPAGPFLCPGASFLPLGPDTDRAGCITTDLGPGTWPIRGVKATQLAPWCCEDCCHGNAFLVPCAAM